MDGATLFKRLLWFDGQREVGVEVVKGGQRACRDDALGEDCSGRVRSAYDSWPMCLRHLDMERICSMSRTELRRGWSLGWELQVYGLPIGVGWNSSSSSCDSEAVLARRDTDLLDPRTESPEVLRNRPTAMLGGRQWRCHPISLSSSRGDPHRPGSTMPPRPTESHRVGTADLWRAAPSADPSMPGSKP